MIGKAIIGALVVFSGLITAVQAGSTLDIQEGLWEITSTVKMQGMTIPPMTFSQCMTQADAVPRNGTSGEQDCEVTAVNTTENTVTWSMVCSGQAREMQGKGSITYHGDRFEGQMSTKSMGMEIITEMQGERIGPCEGTTAQP